MKRRYLVTGATGFIGGHLVNQLVRNGNDVIALRRPGSNPSVQMKIEPHWIEGDLSSVNLEGIGQIDSLFHLAAHGVDPEESNWGDCFKWNLQHSLDFWLRCSEIGIGKFIICGSCFEYGRSGESFDFIPTSAPLRPTGPYHASKAAATMAASAFAEMEKKKVWLVRPFQVYGEGESGNRLYTQILKAARKGEDIRLTEGEQIRDFIKVERVAKLLEGYSFLLDEVEGLFNISNIGTGHPQRLADFVKSIWEKEGASGKLLFGELPYRKGETMSYVPEIDHEEMVTALELLNQK